MVIIAASGQSPEVLFLKRYRFLVREGGTYSKVEQDLPSSSRIINLSNEYVKPTGFLLKGSHFRFLFQLALGMIFHSMAERKGD